MSDNVSSVSLANKLYGVCIDTLNGDSGVHAETAISSTARMSGMFMLRSFNFDLSNMEPGQVILSDKANEAGPHLVNILWNTLGVFDISIASESLDIDFSDEHKPQLTVLESEAQLTDPIITALKGGEDIDDKTVSEALAMVTGMIINETKNVIDPAIGFSLARCGFVEGIKTVPER